MNNSKFTIDINILKEYKLSLEAYLILYCLSTNNEVLLKYYIVNCKRISTDIFEQLKTNDFITYSTGKDGIIYFKLLSLTDNGKSLFATVGPLDSDSQFEEFRKHYPKSVKDPR